MIHLRILIITGVIFSLLLNTGCQDRDDKIIGKYRPYENYKEHGSTDSLIELYSPILFDDTIFRDVWWQLKAPKLKNGRLSFYYKKPQGLESPIECVSFGHNGLLLLHGAYSTGFKMSSGLVVQDREIISHPANYVFFGERGVGYLGYNWAAKSTNTDEHTLRVLSYDSSGNVSILNENAALITYGADQYYDDVSTAYTDRSKIDKGYADRTYMKRGEISSGTFKPEIIKVQNVSNIKISPQAAHYTCIGNQVNVFLTLDVQALKVDEAISFAISLPVTSDIKNPGDCSGTINTLLDASKPHGVTADVKSDRAIVNFHAISTEYTTCYISFMYTIN